MEFGKNIDIVIKTQNGNEGNMIIGLRKNMMNAFSWEMKGIK